MSIDMCSDEIQQLENAALQAEAQGRFQEALNFNTQLLEEFDENHSVMLEKDVLERISFIHIIQKQFGDALKYQERICEINEQIFTFGERVMPHPLLSIQLYQLAKIQLHLKMDEQATVTLQRVLSHMEPILSMKSQFDGKMIDEPLLN